MSVYSAITTHQPSEQKESSFRMSSLPTDEIYLLQMELDVTCQEPLLKLLWYLQPKKLTISLQSQTLKSPPPSHSGPTLAPEAI